MRTRTSLTLLAILGAAAASARADEPIKHRILFAEYGSGTNRLVEVDPEGKLAWEHKVPSTTVIFQPLANGRVLYAFGGKPTGVREIDREQKVVWEYESKSPQVLGTSRTSEGNTLVAEQGPCRVLEVAPNGEVVRTTPLKTSEEGYHLQVRNVHKLANGNILAAHEGEGAIREYDGTGKVVWEFTKVTNAGDALRLPNGNTLISCGTQKRIIEVAADGSIVWEFGAADAPELNLTWIGGLQVLRNGHYVVSNFLRGQEGKGAHAFEVTRQKQVVWKFADHAMARSITTLRVLDDDPR